VTIELITTHHIADESEFAAEVHDLLNAAFPEGAPNELAGYYARHGFPTATLLLKEERRVIGHLAIYEREIMTALWTEACLSFPAIDALAEGYEVYVVADAVGGTSVTAHEMGLRRIEQAGGKMISVPQLFCELQRDWSRKETVPAFMNLFIETGGTAGIQFSYDRTEG
jgi:nicotinamidase-related amidase